MLSLSPAALDVTGPETSGVIFVHRDGRYSGRRAFEVLSDAFQSCGIHSRCISRVSYIFCKSAALSVAARRSIRLKTWAGDTASKLHLCNIPFSGDLLFGPDLKAALERTADRKKMFPTKKKVFPKKFFSSQKEPWNGNKDARPKRPWTDHNGKPSLPAKI